MRSISVVRRFLIRATKPVTRAPQARRFITTASMPIAVAFCVALLRPRRPSSKCASRLVASAPSELEMCEQLEQLRALSLGMTIAVGIPPVRPGTGVDTEEDLARASTELA
jgi:hypothetical protein